MCLAVPGAITRIIDTSTAEVDMLGATRNISLRLVILDLLGNLVAFAPLAVLLPALFRWQRSIFFFTATLILGITAVEVAQVYTGAGSCDVDDLILNLAGALIVFVFCRITPLWKHICRVNPRPKK